jgi:hypothetical protein
MRNLILGLLCLCAVSSAYALGYDELLSRALATDPGMLRLQMEEERASVALERARISQGSVSFAVKSGDVVVAASPAGASLTLSPSAQAELPGGVAVGAGATIAASGAGAAALPSVSAGIPIVRGADARAMAVADARAGLAAARAARERGALALEQRLINALKAVASVDVTLRAALQDEGSAQRAFERAVSVDGAAPGGGTRLSLERKLRAAARVRRDAEAARADAMAGLRRVFLGSAPADAELTPASWPEPDMTAALPAPTDAYAAAAARAAARLDAYKAGQAERRNSLAASVGASYGIGSADQLAAGGLAGGLGVSAGLQGALGREGLGASCGLAWGSSGLSATLSLSWTPPAAGDEALRARDAGLSARLREQGLAEALAQAAADQESLESRRRDLVEAARDAEEDLAFARTQLEASRARADKGMATEAELSEAGLEVDVCAARVRAAALDRMAWSVDVRLLTTGADAFGDEQ